MPAQDQYPFTSRGIIFMGYPFNLVFTRLFTRGNLEGLTHDDNLPCMTEKDCHDWVVAINANNAKGLVDYIVISYKVMSL
jgi:hypothetical protein